MTRSISRRRVMARPIFVLAPLVFALSAPLRAQQPLTPVTRADAVNAAVARGPRLAVARADTAVASAAMRVATAWPDPTLSPAYSKSTPQYHAIVDVPIELPGLRSARRDAASLGRTAAQYRFAFERAAAALDADTTYTRAVANRALAQLSRRSAADADSLRRMVARRRDAGDASDLDVELATITAGQEANVAISDSLTYLSSVLDLQAVMGIAASDVTITLTDSLGTPAASLPDDTTGKSVVARDSLGAPLTIAAAELSARAAAASVLTERRSVWQAPGIMLGLEWGDPSGAEPGMLPTFGLSLPLPLFNGNRGAIAQADAERMRAEAELVQARVETHADIARTRREFAIAQGRLARDSALVVSAQRVSSMSLTAYREGAAALPNVLEAQRNARDVIAQYIEDLASVSMFGAELRVLTLTPSSVMPR